MDFTVLRKIAEGACSNVFLVQLKQKEGPTHSLLSEQLEETEINDNGSGSGSGSSNNKISMRGEVSPVDSDGFAVLKLAKRGYETLAVVEAVELRRVISSGGHPHIVSVLGLYEGNGVPRGLLLEYCRGGSFGDYLQRGSNSNTATAPPVNDNNNSNSNSNHRREIQNTMANISTVFMPIAIIRRLFTQLLDALLFLESMELWHRDLKPDNILLTSRDITKASLKLSDFGFARRTPYSMLRKDRSCCGGSPAFMSPERLRQFTLLMRQNMFDDVENAMWYDRSKAEVWSAGLILYSMLLGKYIFGTMRSLEELGEAQTQVPNILRRDCYPNGPLSPLLLDLLEKMLHLDPSKRVGMKEVRSHPWITTEIKDNCGAEEPQAALMAMMRHIVKPSLPLAMINAEEEKEEEEEEAFCYSSVLGRCESNSSENQSRDDRPNLVPPNGEGKLESSSPSTAFSSYIMLSSALIDSCGTFTFCGCNNAISRSSNATESTSKFKKIADATGTVPAASAPFSEEDEEEKDSKQEPQHHSSFFSWFLRFFFLRLQ